MAKMKNIYYRIKGLLPFVPLLLKFTMASLKQVFKVLPPNEREILFTLDDDKLYRNDDGSGRYAYLTLNLFTEAGYNVYLYKKINFRGYHHLNQYGRYIYAIKNLKIITRIPERTVDMIYAFDSPRSKLLKRRWKRLTFVNILKPVSCCFGDMVWIPYFLHAKIYRHGQYRRVGLNRNSQKKIRVLFAGNTAARYYNNPGLKKYGQLTRSEGIKTALELSPRIKFTGDVRGFCKFLGNVSYANEGRIVGTDHVFPIHPTQWLKIIAKCDFFICFSGTDLPMCHNAIEAMSVGAIPIISYPDWFFPPLEHRKNAILYTDKEDLKAKLEDVFQMDAAEIQTMRCNVIEYYEKNLTIPGFIRKYEGRGNGINTIMLHPRLICTASEEEQGKRLLDELKIPLRAHP